MAAVQEITLGVTRPRPAITHRQLGSPHYIHIIAPNHAWLSSVLLRRLDIHAVIEPPTPSAGSLEDRANGDPSFH